MAPAENKVFIAVGSSGIEAYISQEVCLDILSVDMRLALEGS
jgi:hypothetical protein